MKKKQTKPHKDQCIITVINLHQVIQDTNLQFSLDGLLSFSQLQDNHQRLLNKQEIRQKPYKYNLCSLNILTARSVLEIHVNLVYTTCNMHAV